MDLLRLSIRQTYASIGIETSKAKLSIESPPGDLKIETETAKMDIQRTPAKLTVDSSKAWMALGKGNHLDWCNMVFSQMDQEYLTNVSRIVEEGNRLAQFTKPGSRIADMMADRIQEKSTIEYNGQASVANVDVHYAPTELDVQWSDQVTQIEYTPQRPQASFEAAVANIYMRNKNSLSMWVNEYDFYS